MSFRPIAIILLCISLFCSSCDRSYESVFGESPDDRVNRSLLEYNTRLTQAPYGWKAFLYTGTNAGYFFYLDFKDDGNVMMLSDFNATSAGDVDNGTWVLKALQRPTLSFTTYSYIHLPADPDGNINNGIPGSGLLSDFEFAFLRTSGDSIILEGVQHQSDLILLPAAQQEQQLYLDKRIQFLYNKTSQFLEANKGYRIDLPGGAQVPMIVDMSLKRIVFQYLNWDQDKIETLSTSYTFSNDGIKLKDDIKIESNVIKELRWDDQLNTFYIPSSQPIALIGYNEPFIFTTAKPLYSELGDQRVSLVIPYTPGKLLAGQSTMFSELYKNAADEMKQGQFNIETDGIEIVFVPNTDRMFLTLHFRAPSNGGYSALTAQYIYSYQVREGGILKFKHEGSDENGSTLYLDMINILSHFENDTFTIEYIGGDFNILAGLFSQETPDYYFSGYLNDRM